MASDASSDPSRPSSLRVGFLGPEGTFTEEALLSEPDYAAADITPFGSLVEVLDAVRDGRVDLGFVPLENAIEGTVRDIVDSLLFDFDLRIQREVVLDRLLALDSEELDTEQIKWVVLMVLSSQPGQEQAFARMEDLVADTAGHPPH